MQFNQFYCTSGSTRHGLTCVLTCFPNFHSFSGNQPNPLAVVGNLYHHSFSAVSLQVASEVAKVTNAFPRQFNRSSWLLPSRRIYRRLVDLVLRSTHSFTLTILSAIHILLCRVKMILISLKNVPDPSNSKCGKAFTDNKVCPWIKKKYYHILSWSCTRYR